MRQKKPTVLKEYTVIKYVKAKDAKDAFSKEKLKTPDEVFRTPHTLSPVETDAIGFDSGIIQEEDEDE